MTKRLTILLFGLFIPLAFADIAIDSAVSASNSSLSKPEATAKVPAKSKIKLDIAKDIVKPIDPPTVNSQPTDTQALNFALSRSAGGNLDGEEGINEVLPDLFNAPTGQESFGIRGDVIKSVHLKERGDIDGANIQFIFRQ